MDKMTWEEIRQKFPNEWVALVEVEWPDTGDVQAGVVYAHSPSKKQLIELQKGLSSAAVVWTGKKLGSAMLSAVDVDK